MKKKTSRFEVSFTVEVEHGGDDAQDATNAVEQVVTELWDHAPQALKSGHGVKITDSVNFCAKVE